MCEWGEDFHLVIHDDWKPDVTEFNKDGDNVVHVDIGGECFIGRGRADDPSHLLVEISVDKCGYPFLILSLVALVFEVVDIAGFGEFVSEFDEFLGTAGTSHVQERGFGISGVAADSVPVLHDGHCLTVASDFHWAECQPNISHAVLCLCDEAAVGRHRHDDVGVSSRFLEVQDGENDHEGEHEGSFAPLCWGEGEDAFACCFVEDLFEEDGERGSLAETEVAIGGVFWLTELVEVPHRLLHLEHFAVACGGEFEGAAVLVGNGADFLDHVENVFAGDFDGTTGWVGKHLVHLVLVIAE